MCTHPIDLMNIHLLCNVHDNKHIRTHDTICDTFVDITRDVGFHMGLEQLHVLSLITFKSFHR
jgi:hypothetical protein